MTQSQWNAASGAFWVDGGGDGECDGECECECECEWECYIIIM